VLGRLRRGCLRAFGRNDGKARHLLIGFGLPIVLATRSRLFPDPLPIAPVCAGSIQTAQGGSWGHLYFHYVDHDCPLALAGLSRHQCCQRRRTEGDKAGGLYLKGKAPAFMTQDRGAKHSPGRDSALIGQASANRQRWAGRLWSGGPLISGLAEGMAFIICLVELGHLMALRVLEWVKI
jgi:hypothetical protein